MDGANQFRVIPVLDVKRGIAVHGRAGRRDEYLPVESVFASSAEPLSLARGMRDTLGLQELYVADLDAIGGAEPDWNLLRALRRESIRIFVDAGIQDLERAKRVLDVLQDAVVLVIGLESIASLDGIRMILNGVPAHQRMVSLDMDHGVVRTTAPPWTTLGPLEVAEALLEMGVDQLLLLDIARVGMEQGTGTNRLAASVLQAVRRRIVNGGAALSLRELWCGGGIRTLHEVEEARANGCNGILVATALHSGRIGRGELQQLQVRSR